MEAAVQAAIARGTETAALLIASRDEFFPACEAVLRIAGPDGLRACMAGVVEAVIAQHKNPIHPEGGV